MMTKETIAVAVLGNPNVGKSALFNALTGSAQVIGNWCGKTTEACSVLVEYTGRKISFTDLPGIYGFGHSTYEEITTDKYLHSEEPDIPLLVVDSLNLERNLYLVLEVLERYQRAVVVLNKMDAAAEHGMEIDHERLAGLLGVPVIPTVATGTQATADLFQPIIAVADGTYPLNPYRVHYAPHIEQAITDAEKHLSASQIGSHRWLAVEAVEEQAEELQVEIINTRYASAAEITAQCMVHHATESLTDKIDYWALHRVAGVPIMIVVFAILFFLTFSVSRPLSQWIGDAFSSLGDLSRDVLPAWGVPAILISLLADGLLNGIGATLGFLPQIAIFFLVYSLIQDSGYIVRVAFLMDRVMSAIGLNGKIFIPLVAGYSCNIDGILASRILTSRYDRMVAVLASTFAPCSARLGVMVFMVSAFFPSLEATVVMLVLLGISVAMMALTAFLVRYFVPQEESSGFMTEVPVYHLPQLKSLLIGTSRRTLGFLHRIRNVIIYSSVLIWFLSTFPQGDFEQSYIAHIGQAIEPFGMLLGLNWQLIVALIMGIPAKESALTALGVIYHATSESGNLGQVMAAHISPLAAFTFLVVYMTYIPCLATVITIYQEMRNWSMAILSVYGSVFLSLLLGILAFNIGRLFI
ncbi:MAG: ferrous iron transport protein B [Negativicutes bacterium]|nr:ferrous iron transport protein B [Negativicutes bacterium]